MDISKDCEKDFLLFILSHYGTLIKLSIYFQECIRFHMPSLPNNLRYQSENLT